MHTRIQFCLVIFCVASIKLSIQESELLVVGVATEETDGYLRFIRSLNVFGYEYTIYGLDEDWKGGNTKMHPGGGQKVNILARELEKYKNDKDRIILFSDSYDAVFNQPPDEAIRRFKELNAKIVFGAELFCWPDLKLAKDYPEVSEDEYRFLNSGGIMGYAPELYEVVTSSPIKDDDDDQLFYTKIFLNKAFGERISMKLDTRAEIFQNLNGASPDILFYTVNNEVFVYNNKTKTLPVVVHGNGASKQSLNYLTNYITRAWSTEEGCLICDENELMLDDDIELWPTVTIAIFIEKPTPFLREFLGKVLKINYPKEKISILLHNNIKYHTEEVAKFFETAKLDYASVKFISPEEDTQGYEARAEAIEECKRTNCKYYFTLDSTAHIDNPDTLKLLIQQNRPVIAPILKRPYSSWSNYWGAITTNGFYLRSSDYMEIVEGKKYGVWNVPFISQAILINSEVFNRAKINFEDSVLDTDIMLAKSLREQDVFMYATNMNEFGHLVNPETFNTSLTRPEMYQIFDNYDDWAMRYISPAYYTALNPNTTIEQPCPDVFWFPVVTEEFCASLIDMMETFGEWSGGRNYDPRLPGGYENVPTVDIHMKQVGWENHWLLFLRRFIQPMQQKLFLGYFHDPPNALLNFVVRYRPGEQDHLKPHHDASTYTINVALNRPKIDFEGGGCRFVRYNCSVIDPRIGWTFIHPGRLTHYHEGLKVTNGTRYIMVSFVDP